MSRATKKIMVRDQGPGPGASLDTQEELPFLQPSQKACQTLGNRHISQEKLSWSRQLENSEGWGGVGGLRVNTIPDPGNFAFCYNASSPHREDPGCGELAR